MLRRDRGTTASQGRYDEDRSIRVRNESTEDWKRWSRPRKTGCWRDIGEVEAMDLDHETDLHRYTPSMDASGGLRTHPRQRTCVCVGGGSLTR